MRNKIFGSLILISLLISCNKKGNTSSGNEADTVSYRVNYAEMFRVNRFPDYTEVQVRDPWDTTRLLQKYILIPKTSSLPASLYQKLSTPALRALSIKLHSTKEVTIIIFI